MREVAIEYIYGWIMTGLGRTIFKMYFVSGMSAGAKIGPLILSVVVILCSKSTDAQSVDPLPSELHRPQVPTFMPVPVKKLCGRLQTGQKGVIVAVPKAQLKLYEEKEGKSCCKDAKLVGSRTTTARGDFNFVDTPSGRYWLEVEWGGKEKTIAIDLDPRHDWQGSCENQGLLIEEKYLTWIAGQAIM